MNTVESGSPPRKAQVLIARGGPCGLMLAIDLGRRGISVLLVDDKSGNAFNPQANALVLVRPDQIVAWRGNDASGAAAVADRLLGLRGS